MNRVLAIETPELIIGFKLSADQCPAVYDAVLPDRSVTKLLLRRRNRIRTYVSELVASRSGQWESYPWSAFEQNKLRIELDVNALRTHVELNERYYRDVVARIAGPVIALTYETLELAAEQRRLLVALGADPDVRLEAKTERFHTAPLRELVVNIEDARAALRGTDLEHDLDE